MNVDIIDTYARFEALKENWEGIYAADPEAQFFLSWIWLSQVFLQHPKEWYVLAVKTGDNQTHHNNGYVAFLPLRLKTRWSLSQNAFCNEIRMAGTLFWADYTGLLCHPDHETQAIPALATQLKSMHWRELALKNIRISEKRFDLLTYPFHKSIFSHKPQRRISKTDNVDRLICPYVKLPISFDTYLTEKLSANTRQKVRRFLRKVENDGDLRITHSTPETQQRDLDILVDYWKKKWTDRKGDDIDRLACKYWEILRQGLQSGVVFMPMLWRGEIPLGALASFVDRQKQTLLFFVAGRDETCSNPPPGLILHAYSIRWAIANGLTTYEFLRGNEPYKYAYGVAERHIKYLIISTKSGANLNRTLDPKSIDYVLREATRLQKSGRLRQASIGFQQILEVQPNHIVTLRRYARLLYQENQFAEAQGIYLRWVENDPINLEGWQGLGKSHLALHEFDKALWALRKAVELDIQGTVSTLYYLGCALQGQDRVQEAKNTFEMTLNLAPTNPSDRKKQQEIQNHFL